MAPAAAVMKANDPATTAYLIEPDEYVMVAPAPRMNSGRNLPRPPIGAPVPGFGEAGAFDPASAHVHRRVTGVAPQRCRSCIVVIHRIEIRGPADVLEIAVLGLLNESPMHGYELRKRLPTCSAHFGRSPMARSTRPSGGCPKPGGSPRSLRSTHHRRRRGPGAANGSTGSPPKARNISPTYSPRSDPTRSTTKGSGRGWRSSPRRGRTSGCRSSRVGAGASRNSATACAARSPEPGERVDRYTRELHEHGLESVDREVRWLTS